MGLEQHSSQQEINMPCSLESRPAICCGRGITCGVISSKRYKHSSATSLTQIESQSHTLTHIHSRKRGCMLNVYVNESVWLRWLERTVLCMCLCLYLQVWGSKQWNCISFLLSDSNHSALYLITVYTLYTVYTLIFYIHSKCKHLHKQVKDLSKNWTDLISKNKRQPNI